MKYPVCVVKSIITPGKYCLVSTNKEHVSEVLELEEHLRAEMLSQPSASELSYDMFVAVEKPKGKFKRGITMSKLRDDLFEVLLVDYGELIQVTKSNLRLMSNQDYLKTEPLSFIVKLHGLIPVTFVTVGEERKAKASKLWSTNSVTFVQNIFKKNPKAVVQSILFKHRTIFGDLFIQTEPNTKFTSLRKLLCKHKFCVFSESNFLRLEGLHMPSESVGLEKKMEWVEKWRKDNFESQSTSFQPHMAGPSTGRAVSGVATLTLSGSKSDSQSQAEVFANKSTTEGTMETEKRSGFGRGKMKNVIAQLKKMESSSSDTSKEEKPRTSETKVASGKQQRRKTSRKVKTSQSVSDTTQDLVSTLETSSEGDKPSSQGATPPVLSKVERAVIKPGEFSEFTESPELTEASLSIEDVLPPPPLVRGLKLKGEQLESTVIEEELESGVVQEGQLESAVVQEGLLDSAVVQGQLEIAVVQERQSDSAVVEGQLESAVAQEGQLESTILKEQDNLSEFLCDTKPKSEMKASEILDPVRTESDSAKTFPKDTRWRNWTEKVWERPSNQISLSCTSTPYVLFDDSIVEPANSFAELPIRPSIIQNLEKGGKFRFLSQVQRWAIPAIRKQLNTIIIGSSKTGKTLSYVVSLIDYIQDDCYFEELPPGNGPSVVILASSSRVCESIYYLCHSLFGYHTKSEFSNSSVKIVLAHGGGCEKEVWVSLTNGCDILISTPHCLVRLLESPILTNFERLTCLVFDEIDIISQNPFRKSVRTILEKAEFTTKNRHYQKIFCGEKWTGNVESLGKTYLRPCALVIGSYSEAVVYEGIKPCIHFVDHREKPEVLLNKMKELIGKSKVLVVCEDTLEAIALNDFLVANGIPTLLAHEDFMADKLRDTGVTWKCSKDSALILTDEVLSELNVREAQTLIHYGLPTKSKTNFYLRYLSLETFRRDKHSFSKTQAKSVTKNLQDIILIDDGNHYQLPHIVDFVTRVKGKVPEKIVDKCHDIRRQIEVQKSDSPICENLLSFGRCRSWKSCPKRHAFIDSLDSPGSLPSSGWIKFVVLKIHDASWFSARLVEHTDARGNTSKISCRYLELTLKLSEFYKKESSLRPHGVPKVGDVCAVKTIVLEQDVFYRARVVEYLKVDKYEKPLEVSVKLIDRGDIWQRKNIELYELPESLSKYPPAAVDVRVASLQPLDFDVSWSEVANEFFHNLMTQKLKDNQYWSGRVVLALNNTLFLDRIKRKQFLPHLNIHVFDMTVHDELLNNQLAVPNGDHLPALLKLCSEEGLNVPEDEDIQTEDSAVIQPQWAFLDGDLIEVKFLAAENTSRVFLQPRKLEKVLEEVEEDCQKEGAKTLNEIKGNKRSGETVAVGMFCLALFEDGKWNRGRIESEKEKEWYVYFIDHGDFLYISKTNVVPISQSLLLRLPCQAIECNLVGVQEKEECPLEVLQEVYAFSNDGKDYLYAHVIRNDLEASITKGRKYSLNLTNKKGISVNKMLVDSKMVCAEESEVEYLKNVELSESENEGEEEELVEEQMDDEVEEEVEELAKELVEEQVEKVMEVMEEKKKEEGDMKKGKEKADKGEIPENYVINFTDDLFEDESTQEFLKEFASKVLNFPRINGKGKQEEEKPKPRPLALPPTTPPALTTQTSKSSEKTDPNESLEDDQKPCHSRCPNELELISRENVLTPQVLWCQNHVEVQLKIVLANVKDCNLVCGVNNIYFGCFLGEKFYAVDLRLYGAINPEVTRVSVKAFHVVIVLTKLAYPLWPRLQADEGKLRWINLDVESLEEKDGVFSEKIRAVKQDIEGGIIKKGVENEKINPCSDSEDSEEFEIEPESSENED